MSENYIIAYRAFANVERASRKTMAMYLDSENLIWEPFLKQLTGLPAEMNIQSSQKVLAISDFSAAFQNLQAALEEPGKFSALTLNGFRRSTVVPPPSDTVEGRLIIGLHTAGRSDDALAAYVRFVAAEIGANLARRASGRISMLYERGDLLLAAAHAASVLPYQKLAASRLKTVETQMVGALTALDRSVGEAEQVNVEHASNLADYRERFAGQASKLRGFFIRAERRRTENYGLWRRDIDAEVSRRFTEAEGRIATLDKLAERQQESRKRAFEELKDLFHTQLRLRAPVALWEKRAGTHRIQSRRALRNFWITVAFSIALGIGAPYCAGDYVAASFTTHYCPPDQPQNCVRQFSAKGPLTVAGLLLTLSLILWMTRLQYRIFLSERHLSLDAEEKKAFAETFMALKEDSSVDVANETIVLAALFRSTQDGMIKDEASGFDLSTVALLAKQMAK